MQILIGFSLARPRLVTVFSGYLQPVSDANLRKVLVVALLIRLCKNFAVCWKRVIPKILTPMSFSIAKLPSDPSDLISV